MDISPNQLKREISQWSADLGFQGFGVTHCNLETHGRALQQWTSQGLHGEMEYMVRHGTKRSHPEALVPGTLSLLSFRMNYLPPEAANSWEILGQQERGFVSRYALGRDYHKVMRNRLGQLARQIENRIGPFGHRLFVDSAPVLEKGIAENSGVGWIGKHSNLIHRRSGSWFFLGEIYSDLPLEPDPPATNHCGSCDACITVCPTDAIVAPYRVDARRCISYLTIELHGSIPPEFRKAMGNRIYGCDDCQLICPWNRFAEPSPEPDYRIRHNLDTPELVELFHWSEEQFLSRMEGSPIRRIGHERWLRNIAVALGNCTDPPFREQAISALDTRAGHPSEMVREHVVWALEQLMPGDRVINPE